MLTLEVKAVTEWPPKLLAELQKRLVGILKDHRNLAVFADMTAS